MPPRVEANSTTPIDHADRSNRWGCWSQRKELADCKGASCLADTVYDGNLGTIARVSPANKKVILSSLARGVWRVSADENSDRFATSTMTESNWSSDDVTPKTSSRKAQKILPHDNLTIAECLASALDRMAHSLQMTPENPISEASAMNQKVMVERVEIGVDMALTAMLYRQIEQVG